MGYLYFQQRDFEKAAGYLIKATTLEPHDVTALTLLGRTYLERRDSAAAAVLERTVSEDEEYWLSHELLADAYLQQNNYDKARAEAQAAISKSKKEAGPAWLILGQALIKLGLDQQGTEALSAFLQEWPGSPVADDVRRLIAEVRQRKAGAPPAGDTVHTEVGDAGIDPLQALAAPGFSVKSWQPPAIDKTKIALVRGIACPSERVVEEAGKHVDDFVSDVGRIAAIEDMSHESLDAFGIPLRTEVRKYNYVASISEPQRGSLLVEEYRGDKSVPKDYPDQIVSTGFAALALVFHAQMRDNFDIRCEGLGDWHGRASWIMSFRQRDDKPNRMHSYKINNVSYPVKLRGQAWITADKFQIVRIESEIVDPIPAISLVSEHWAVEYGPVRFEKKNASLWLPKSAEIYFEFQRHRYHRRHSFDHYMLFSVDVKEKDKDPGNQPTDKPKQPDHGDSASDPHGALAQTFPYCAHSSVGLQGPAPWAVSCEAKG
jgi:hypothetical protein